MTAGARPPGTLFLYNSGDTYLLGAALARAVGEPFAGYMSETIWQPAGMCLRDFGHFALFVLNDGVMAALGHAGQRIDIFRGPRLIVVTLAAFPQPPYVPATDHNRRDEVVTFARAVRAA